MRRFERLSDLSAGIRMLPSSSNKSLSQAKTHQQAVTQYAMIKPAKNASASLTSGKQKKQYPHSQSRNGTSVYPWTFFRPYGKRPCYKDWTCPLVTPPHLRKVQSEQSRKYPLHPRMRWVVPENPQGQGTGSDKQHSMKAQILPAGNAERPLQPYQRFPYIT